MSNSICLLPGKQVDSAYKQLIQEFSRLGPKDAAFEAALDDLEKYTPSSSEKALLKCELKGGRKIKPSKRSKRGGANETVSEQKSKKHCYIKALAKVTMGVVGVGVGGFYMISPYISAALPQPCSGLVDQAFGFVGGFIDPSVSCSARQQAYDSIVSNYITQFASATGLTLGTAVLSSPAIFKVIIKYLAAKECPELFDNYSLNDLKNDISVIRGVAPQQVQQSIPAQQASQVQDQSEYDEKEMYEEPEDVSRATTRRSTRTRRGGRKTRRTKRKSIKKSRKGSKLKRNTKRSNVSRRKH